MSVDYHLITPELQVEDPDFDRFCDAIIKAQKTAVENVSIDQAN